MQTYCTKVVMDHLKAMGLDELKSLYFKYLRNYIGFGLISKKIRNLIYTCVIISFKI